MADNSSDNIFKNAQLTGAQQEFAKHIKPIVDELEKEKSVSKSTVSKQVEGIAGALADVMDTADGKKDGLIHPKEAIKGLEAALQSPELKEMQGNPQFLNFKRQVEEYKKIADKMPDTLNVDQVRENLAKSLHGLNEMVFQKLDTNKDGKITEAEMGVNGNANLPKLTGGPQSSPARG